MDLAYKNNINYLANPNFSSKFRYIKLQTHWQIWYSGFQQQILWFAADVPSFSPSEQKFTRTELSRAGKAAGESLYCLWSVNLWFEVLGQSCGGLPPFFVSCVSSISLPTTSNCLEVFGHPARITSIWKGLLKPDLISDDL